jgi:hypothetical protein|tara:strand:+ start:941 stop:1099 length:159 start_codon:yes stop_codon:yes gene_type:complete
MNKAKLKKYKNDPNCVGFIYGVPWAILKDWWTYKLEDKKMAVEKAWQQERQK